MNNGFDSGNYKKWRKIHGAAFGNIFTDAFEENDEMRIFLTSALTDISQRRFADALPKLEILGDACFGDFDTAAVNYFKGLDHEMLGNTREMSEYYEELLSSPVKFEYPLSFHPYYRTAKTAQRDSECSKAMYYYGKALDFYKNAEPTPNAEKSASHILYDIAAVYTYMHQYDRAEETLKFSLRYSSSEHHHRDYVAAILHAIHGRVKESNELISGMPESLSKSCLESVKAILFGVDPHYCRMSRDRSFFDEFAVSVLNDTKKIREMIARDELKEAEKVISEKLTAAFSFAGRKLECRIEIEKNSEEIVIKCKNYYIKTLSAEYKALFSMLNEKLCGHGLKFVSICEFEHF